MVTACRFGHWEAALAADLIRPTAFHFRVEAALSVGLESLVFFFPSLVLLLTMLFARSRCLKINSVIKSAASAFGHWGVYIISRLDHMVGLQASRAQFAFLSGFKSPCSAKLAALAVKFLISSLNKI